MMASDVLAMILAGGKGTRLGSLTQNQAKPGVPFGGRYRIIDFTISNCVNSGIDNIGVITQYIPLKLNSHIGNGSSWGLDGLDSSINILQPYTDNRGSRWFEGTAHSIYQNIDFIDRQGAKYLLILSGDHIYKMDYDEMIQQHIDNNATLTVAVMDVPMEDASRYGIMNTDVSNQIIDFEEKPAQPKSNHASMGIYIFDWQRLRDVLTTAFSTDNQMLDFGKNVIPFYLQSDERVFAYQFSGYRRDVGTIDSLWNANMELLDPNNELNLYDRSWRIYSKDTIAAPQLITGNATVKDSMVVDGCYVDGEVEHSILSVNANVKKGAKITDSVIMPGAIIGEGAVINHAIIGGNAEIGRNKVIDGQEEVAVIGNNERVGVIPNENE